MVLLSGWGLDTQPDYKPLFNELYIDLDDKHLAGLVNNDKGDTKLFCYISVGSAENWRSDYSDLVQYTDRVYPNWEDERLFPKDEDIPNKVYEVMKARIKRAKTLGCDGIDLDNTDNVYDDMYMRRIESYIRRKGLVISYKNDLDRYRYDKLTPDKRKDNLVVEVSDYLNCPEDDSEITTQFKHVYCLYYDIGDTDKKAGSNIVHMGVTDGENWSVCDDSCY